MPATEEQIQQLQDILAEYHHTIPAAYLYYLKRMGKDDGGLLERELDFCEADIDTVLDLQNEEDLEKGLFCFAYCDPFTIGFYMKLSSMDDNPSVVTDWEEKNAESFEKYLFQRAFHMYQDSFAHRDVDSNSVCNEEKNKDDCRTCPYQYRTEKERMDWVVQTAKSYNFEKAWFSDQTHFICYTLNYALEIKVCDEYSMRFCCNNAFDYAAETADTDMVSCFCGSVYSSKKKQLVIAPLTAEEFYNGQAGYFDKRINAICPGHDYRLFCAGICPYCGKSSIQSSKKGFTIKDYCAHHPNTLMIYHDGTARILKDELEAASIM